MPDEWRGVFAKPPKGYVNVPGAGGRVTGVNPERLRNRTGRMPVLTFRASAAHLPWPPVLWPWPPAHLSDVPLPSGAAWRRSPAG